MLNYSDLLILIPSFIALSFILFVSPLIKYFLARLFLKVWPKVAFALGL